MTPAEMLMMDEVEKPKSSDGMVDLPCGYLTKDGELYLEATVREITGGEEDMLASDSVAGDKKFNELLIRCTKSIGPVTDPEIVRAMLPALPIGDRVCMLFGIRRITLGDIYPFGIRCPQCSKPSSFHVNLAELEIKRMKEPTKRVYDEELPSGTKARFRVMTGADEGKVKKAAKKFKDDGPSLAILARLELLGDGPPTLEGVKKLGLRDRNFLRKKFNEVEGGVDTSLEITCPSCGHEFNAELSIEGKAFFFPSEESSL
jgi:hypothetical protein